MKKIIPIVVLAVLCLNFTTKAQSKTAIENLRVGDKMPDVEITNIINSRIKSAKISDFKGKLIILDFWHTWCSACIEGFPKLDSLQRQFPNKLQIFLVDPKKEGGDTEKGVQIVINRINDWSARKIRLPIVFPDTAISQNFIVKSVPHCVWIDGNGVIIAITGKEPVTRENISKIINGEKNHFPVKKD